MVKSTSESLKYILIIHVILRCIICEFSFCYELPDFLNCRKVNKDSRYGLNLTSFVLQKVNQDFVPAPTGFSVSNVFSIQTHFRKKDRIQIFAFLKCSTVDPVINDLASAR